MDIIVDGGLLSPTKRPWSVPPFLVTGTGTMLKQAEEHALLCQNGNREMNHCLAIYVFSCCPI